MFPFRPDINNVFAVGLENISQIINHSSFDPNRTTVVHVHGLNQSPIQLRVQIITEAYLYVGGHNIILLDWAIPASESYLQAVLNEIAVNSHILRLHKNTINPHEFKF